MTNDLDDPEKIDVTWHQVGGCDLSYTELSRWPSITVNHADATVFIATELLMDLLYHPEQCNPALSLTGPRHGGAGHFDADNDECGAQLGTVCFRNNLLRIAGDNRTVVYRIVRYLHEKNCWLGQWPD